MFRRRPVASTFHAALLALVLAPQGATAAPDCLAAPNRTPDEGQHWYYRTDRGSNQKCWYLRDRDVATTGSVTGEPRARPDAAERREATALDDGAQKALFQDFLRWYKERSGAQ